MCARSRRAGKTPTASSNDDDDDATERPSNVCVVHMCFWECAFYVCNTHTTHNRHSVGKIRSHVIIIRFLERSFVIMHTDMHVLFVIFCLQFIEHTHIFLYTKSIYGWHENQNKHILLFAGSARSRSRSWSSHMAHTCGKFICVFPPRPTTPPRSLGRPQKYTHTNLLRLRSGENRKPNFVLAR